VTANPEPLLNLAEAAAWLGIGQSTLRLKLYEGKGPISIRLPGSDRWRFRVSDLTAYVESSVVTPPAEPPPPFPSVKARRDMVAARRAKAAMELAKKKAKEPAPEPIAPKPKRQRERERVTA
jgi:predicted DNA-binding transcriptional regulator AlpA